MVLAREVLSGQGGGLSIPIKTSAPVKVVDNNSNMFINNFANNYEGGLYQFITEKVSNQTYMFGNNKFINSTAIHGAGAVNFGNLDIKLTKEVIMLFSTTVHLMATRLTWLVGYTYYHHTMATQITSSEWNYVNFTIIMQQIMLVLLTLFHTIILAAGSIMTHLCL